MTRLLDNGSWLVCVYQVYMDALEVWRAREKHNLERILTSFMSPLQISQRFFTCFPKHIQVMLKLSEEKIKGTLHQAI